MILKKLVKRKSRQIAMVWVEESETASIVHLEVDTSDYLALDDVTKYQSLIGSLQWAISLGRFNIQTMVMILSCFRVNPR